MGQNLIHVREVTTKEGMVTLDGGLIIYNHAYPMRVQNLFVGDTPVDVLITPSTTLMPQDFLYDNGVDFKFAYGFNLLGSPNPGIDGQFRLPIMRVGDYICVLLSNETVERFDLYTGAFVDSFDISIPNVSPSNAALRSQNKSIGFVTIFGNPTVVNIAGYQNTLNPNSPFNVNYKMLNLNSLMFETVEFPLDLVLNPNLASYPQAFVFQMSGRGATVSNYMQFMGTPSQVLYYFGNDAQSYLTSAAMGTYTPQMPPIQYPFSAPLNDYQVLNFTGFRSLNLSATMYYHHESTFPPNSLPNPHQCFANTYNVFANGLIINVVDGSGFIDTLGYYPYYQDDFGKIVAFTPAEQKAPFVCEGGEIGVLLEATNGKFYYVNTRKGGVDPGTLKVTLPTFYSADNYTRLL